MEKQQSCDDLTDDSVDNSKTIETDLNKHSEDQLKIRQNSTTTEFRTAESRAVKDMSSMLLDLQTKVGLATGFCCIC